MSNVLRIALVDPNAATRDRLKSLLLSMETVWLEADTSRYELFRDVIAQTSPDVGVLTLDSDPDAAIQLIEQLTQQFPGVVLLVVSSSTDGQLILRSIRAGAREFLPLPIEKDELDAAMLRVSTQKFGAADGKKSGCEVIAVAGAKGGVGCTSVASNIGCILASEARRSVALLDLDLALGDADVFLNVIPDYTVADVVQNVAEMDIQLLKKSLTRHSSGLHLLPRPVELRETMSITEDSVHRVIGLLKASFTHLVIDLSKTYSTVDLAAMQLASKIVLVTQLDLPSLRNIVRLLMSFEDLGGLLDKVEIVVNRAGLDTGQISLKKARETLGRDIFALLPNDYRTMVSVRNNGVPLLEQAPKAAITLALRDLVNRLVLGQTADTAVISEVPEASEGRWTKFWPGSKTRG